MVFEQARAKVSETTAPEEKNTLSRVFWHACTFRAVSRHQIRGSYLLVAAYSVEVALATLLVYVLVLMQRAGFAAVKQAAPSLAAATASLTVVLIVSSMIATLGNCWLLGHNLSPKEHLIFVSSMTYLPLIVGLRFFSDIVSSIASFALLLLNSYYLSTSYQDYVDAQDTRLSVLHQVYIFVAYLSVMYLCQFSFMTFVG